MHWKWLISGVPERRTHSHTHTNYILYLHYYSWRRLNVADDRLINWNFSVIFIYFGQRSKIRTACEASVWCSFCFCCFFFFLSENMRIGRHYFICATAFDKHRNMRAPLLLSSRYWCPFGFVRCRRVASVCSICVYCSPFSTSSENVDDIYLF